MEKEGTSSSSETESTVEAISYALGKGMNTDFNNKQLRDPVLVEKLPPKVPLNTGEAEEIEEVSLLIKLYIFLDPNKRRILRWN
jgi:hypothetical protein